MKRRQYIKWAGFGTMALAGCSGMSDDTTPSHSNNPTSSPSKETAPPETPTDSSDDTNYLENIVFEFNPMEDPDGVVVDITNQSDTVLHYASVDLFPYNFPLYELWPEQTHRFVSDKHESEVELKKNFYFHMTYNGNQVWNSEEDFNVPSFKSMSDGVFTYTVDLDVSSSSFANANLEALYGPLEGEYFTDRDVNGTANHLSDGVFELQLDTRYTPYEYDFLLTLESTTSQEEYYIFPKNPMLDVPEFQFNLNSSGDSILVESIELSVTKSNNIPLLSPKVFIAQSTNVFTQNCDVYDHLPKELNIFSREHSVQFCRSIPDTNPDGSAGTTHVQIPGNDTQVNLPIDEQSKLTVVVVSDWLPIIVKEFDAVDLIDSAL